MAVSIETFQGQPQYEAPPPVPYNYNGGNGSSGSDSSDPPVSNTLVSSNAIGCQISDGQYLSNFPVVVTDSDEEEAQPGPPQISKIQRFATVVNGFQSLTIVAKLSILDVSGDPGYGSARCILITMMKRVNCFKRIDFFSVGNEPYNVKSFFQWKKVLTDRQKSLKFIIVFDTNDYQILLNSLLSP